MAYTPVSVVQVHAFTHRVGALAYNPSNRYYAFEYDPNWIRTGIQIAPLTMPLRRGPMTFPNLPETTYYRLPAAIADALPDRFGNSLVEAYLTTHGVPATAITPLDRLAYQAARGMGALEFRPDRGPRTTTPTAVNLADLVTAARQAVTGDFATEPDAQHAINELIRVGTSAGGARAKAVIAWNPTTGAIRSGQLPTDPGYEYWLLKLDGVGTDNDLGTGSNYGRIEYAYHLMAKDAGITMTRARLLTENGRAHFMTQRFDRDPTTGTKHHMASLCAMAHLDYNQVGVHDYAQAFDTLDALHLDAATREEQFRRMVFNVAAANCDDHTKNIGFLMTADGTWSLSPAYDLTHAYSPDSPWTYQHLMSVNGKFATITRTDLLAVADRFQIPNARHVLADVATALTHWETHAEAAHLDEQTTAHIRTDFPTW